MFVRVQIYIVVFGAFSSFVCVVYLSCMYTCMSALSIVSIASANSTPIHSAQPTSRQLHYFSTPSHSAAISHMSTNPPPLCAPCHTPATTVQARNRRIDEFIHQLLHVQRQILGCGVLNITNMTKEAVMPSGSFSLSTSCQEHGLGCGLRQHLKYDQMNY